jgi:SAM-dependent methyltransferase
MADHSVTDWLSIADNGRDFHRRQLDRPYRSTVALANFLEAEGLLGSGPVRVLDMAAGMGQVARYLAGRFPAAAFTAVDIHPDLLGEGRAALAGLDNARAMVGDLFEPPQELRGAFDGVLLVNTLNGLDDPARALAALAGLRARWICITSLFHDGEVESDITVRDYTKPTLDKDHTVCRYNVFSLPRTLRALARLGYDRARHIPFVMDIDLPPPADGGMGTFTVPLSNGQRLQMSGPLHLPWRFVVVERSL